MKLTRRHREHAEVSTESLNDIMFFLLLFFLIISTLANPSVLKLTLPSSAASEQMQKTQIKIEVDAEHNYVINATPIPFTDLENALRFELKKAPDAKVVLNFDNSLTIQDLADVMQIGYKLGVKMVLATKSSSK
jgi:biopolymer transport protein ExbD